MSLFVYVPDENLRAEFRKHLNQRRWTDSGFDLPSPATTLQFLNQKNGVEFRLGAHFAALDQDGNCVPYLLLARSSTSLTPLRMSNQIGLADSGYRGELIARVDCVTSDSQYAIDQGRRLFQVVQHNWLPWRHIVLVDSLFELPPSPDNRGAGGFGSTGN